MAAKGLLDVNPDPSAEDVRKAIRGNLCRCTGYRKIIDAVLLAARLRRDTVTCPQSESQTQEETPGRARVQDRPRHSERTRADVEQAWAESQTVFPMESARPTENTSRHNDFTVGSSAFRIDVRDKVLGTGEYVDDLYMEGMLHASAVRSAHPRARVVRIDARKALALPGVVAVLTAKDVPHPEVDFFGTPDKSGRYWLDKLCGTDAVRTMIVAGETAEAIKASWQMDIEAFREQRKPYLLYEE